tara:strand:- start:254 stop:1198 length:945 start_codon:yes stop_codon:yes gene_type:complete
MPTHNDWRSVLALIERIDEILLDTEDRASILVVDDASTRFEIGESYPVFEKIDSVEILCLNSNMGNQRAIAIGIGYLAQQSGYDYLAVMDSDHEDDPTYLPALIRKSQATGNFVFAERSRRSEGPLFVICYRIYQVVFRFLVGHRISIGNYSVVPANLVRRLAHLSGLWMQYPSTIMREKIPFHTIPTKRGRRIDGKSAMRFSSLVAHGFAGFAVFADTVAARLMILSCLLLVVVTTAAGALGYGFAIEAVSWPWFLGALIVFLSVFAQFLLTAIVLMLVTLINRTAQPVIPYRDHSFYLRNIDSLDDFIANSK